MKKATQLVDEAKREGERRWGAAEVEADFVAGQPPVVRARPAPPEDAPAWMWRRGLALPPKG